MKRVASLFLSVAALVMTATPPQWAVDTLAGKPYMRHASLGIAVADVTTGELVASHSPEQSDITASTMKTLTSFAALRLLGSDFRFETPVYAVGEIDDNKLHGDLVVCGSGDPTLGSRYIACDTSIIERIVNALKQRNITRIDGDIVIDKSIYDNTVPFYGDWNVNDLGWSYGAAVHAFNYRDNVVDLTFDVDSDGTRTLFTVPTVPGLGIIDLTRFSSRGSNLDCTVDYGSPALVLYGQVNAGSHGFDIVNPLPDRLFIRELENALSNADIEVKHKHKNHGLKRELLTIHHSPALTAIITSLLDRSDNMFAHGLLRAIAARDKAWLDAAGQARDLDAIGVGAVKSMLNSLGVDTSALFMRDGSGLSRPGKSSAHFFTDMLTVALKQDMPVPLHTLMPLAGKRVGGPLSGSPLAQQIVLKSGSMNNVQCFVGYFPADRPRYTWAVLVNNYTCDRATLRADLGALLVNLFGNE